MPVGAIAAGDVIVVRPGELFAADGEVLTGMSTVDKTAVTGESRLDDIAPGSKVFAGTRQRRRPRPADRGRQRCPLTPRPRGADARGGGAGSGAVPAALRPSVSRLPAGGAHGRRDGIVLHVRPAACDRGPGRRLPHCAAVGGTGSDGRGDDGGEPRRHPSEERPVPRTDRRSRHLAARQDRHGDARRAGGPRDRAGGRGVRGDGARGGGTLRARIDPSGVARRRGGRGRARHDDRVTGRRA